VGDNMVGVLLATYNGEKFIGQQIESILAQTYADFKLIIADDCSIDNTYMVADSYKVRFPQKIVLYKNKFPTGSAKGNFFCMFEKYSKEFDYIIFADQDDVWLLQKLEKMMFRMKQLEKKYTKNLPLLVHSNLSVTDENLNIIYNDMEKLTSVNSHSLNRLLVENSITGNSMLINKKLIEIYKEPKDCIMHDWWFALIASSLGKISFIKETLTLYRQHEKNTLGVSKINIFNEVKNRVKNYKKEKKRVRENYNLMFKQAQSLYNYYSKDMKQDKKKIVKEFLKLKEKNRIEKIISIIRNRFYKSTFPMTIGQMFNI
jgi:glycosyltransferase, family 2